jgi:histidine ammonia-lyase
VQPVELSGSGLTPVGAVALGQRRTPVGLSADARRRMAATAAAVAEFAETRPVYGRTTGVGANRDVLTDDAGHGARLLASHSTTGTVSYPKDVVRLGLLIRVNQLAAGGSGLAPGVADAIVALLNDDDLPDLHRGGAIGTGDLGPLAELGLALGDVIDGTSALPLLSSNAITLAECCLAYVEAATLVNVVPLVGAVAHVALRGNPEAYDVRVHQARPHPGQQRVARRLRGLLDGIPLPPARIQDPFGLRAFAQVLGPAVEDLDALQRALSVDINAAAENPLVAGEEILHHGGFHAASCALALDTLRLALVPFAALSAARLSHLMSPELTGLAPFLSADAPGSSGVLIAEYLAADALARLRAEAVPAVLGGVTISRAVEEHASFAWQGAGQARRAVAHLRAVLALEWVAAERALRMKRVPPDEGPLAPARALADGFDPRLEDREIAADAALAEATLPALAEVVRSIH